MRDSNWLAKIFDWAGDVFERFNPSAFRFLAAVLPYLTPLPVAWLTAHSASTFLGFPPNIAFVFVFALEGIGLWFTSLLVDAFVDWIRSKNLKTFSMVVLFSVVVFIYVTILVNLNVTLESANGATNPALSKVITFMCFLPLLTGVGNGYYKLKLDFKTDLENARIRSEELEERIRQEKRQDSLERYKIKHGIFPTQSETFQSDVESFQKVSKSIRKFPESFYELSSWRKLSKVLSNEERSMLANMTPKEMQECADETGKTYRTISNWRTMARLGEEHE